VFIDIRPRVQRNPATKTIDLFYDIDEAPRVYIERINIVGNTRTRDEVIRREFRLAEGDAFNRVLADRSRTRVRALGFFRDVSRSRRSRLRSRPHGVDRYRYRAPYRRACARRWLFVAAGLAARLQLHGTQSVRTRAILAGQRVDRHVPEGLRLPLHRALFHGAGRSRQGSSSTR
jgi:hypothetical protein